MSDEDERQSTEDASTVDHGTCAHKNDNVDLIEDMLADVQEDVDALDLVHLRITSISALHLNRFTQLRSLCLRQNLITEMDGGLEQNVALEELDLYDNRIQRVQGVSHLKKLTSLDVSFNKLKQIDEDIGSLVSLTDVYFVQNKIKEISDVLTPLVNLRNLELGGNRIRKIENLDALQALEQLWLGKNKIERLQGLSGLKKLKLLSIQSNRITRLEGLEGCESLEELYLSHNGIARIENLEKNGRLRVLDMASNQIVTTHY